jgi:hypothetical protein
MSRLPTPRAEKIAELINDTYCGKYLMDGADGMTYVDGRDLFCRATIELADEHGILLPNLESSREWFAVGRNERLELLEEIGALRSKIEGMQA